MASLEFWSALFNGAVVVLTALLAIAGYFAWKYSEDLGALKDEALRKFQAESTERSKSLGIELENSANGLLMLSEICWCSNNEQPRDALTELNSLDCSMASLKCRWKYGSLEMMQNVGNWLWRCAIS